MDAGCFFGNFKHYFTFILFNYDRIYAHNVISVYSEYLSAYIVHLPLRYPLINKLTIPRCCRPDHSTARAIEVVGKLEDVMELCKYIKFSSHFLEIIYSNICFS